MTPSIIFNIQFFQNQAFNFEMISIINLIILNNRNYFTINIYSFRYLLIIKLKLKISSIFAQNINLMLLVALFVKYST